MALELRILEIKQRTRKQEEILQCQIINLMTQHNLWVIMSCSAVTKGTKGEGNSSLLLAKETLPIIHKVKFQLQPLRFAVGTCSGCPAVSQEKQTLPMAAPSSAQGQGSAPGQEFLPRQHLVRVAAVGLALTSQQQRVLLWDSFVSSLLGWWGHRIWGILTFLTSQPWCVSDSHCHRQLGSCGDTKKLLPWASGNLNLVVI